MTITLSNGETALVDDEDYEQVAQYKWGPHVGKRKRYAITTVYDEKYRRGRKNILMHRLILGLTDPTVFVDHKNHNGLDNRKENLRIATRSQNQRNSRKPKRATSSKYKGVWWNVKYNRWEAQITVGKGKTRYIGRFTSEDDAAYAYDVTAIEIYGEFACLNFTTILPVLPELANSTTINSLELW